MNPFISQKCIKKSTNDKTLINEYQRHLERVNISKRMCLLFNVKFSELQKEDQIAISNQKIYIYFAFKVTESISRVTPKHDCHIAHLYTLRTTMASQIWDTYALELLLDTLHQINLYIPGQSQFETNITLCSVWPWCCITGNPKVTPLNFYLAMTLDNWEPLSNTLELLSGHDVAQLGTLRNTLDLLSLSSLCIYQSVYFCRNSVSLQLYTNSKRTKILSQKIINQNAQLQMNVHINTCNIIS